MLSQYNKELSSISDTKVPWRYRKLVGGTNAPQQRHRAPLVKSIGGKWLQRLQLCSSESTPRPWFKFYGGGVITPVARVR